MPGACIRCTNPGTTGLAGSNPIPTGDKSRNVAPLVREPPFQARSIPESVVQDLWSTQHFDHSDLKTIQGDPVVILDPGQYNSNQGPDFTGVRLQIADIEWAGEVEIHVTSSSWIEHGHDRDPRYNSVILHVTISNDAFTGTLVRSDGSLLPEIVLSPYLKSNLRDILFDYFHRSREVIPCQTRLNTINLNDIEPWIYKLSHDRIEMKSDRLELDRSGSTPFDEVLRIQLFEALGYSKNAWGMGSLARRIPLGICRQLGDPFDLEALHYGVSGLLPDKVEMNRLDRFSYEYVRELNQRFNELNRHFGIQVIDRQSWMFFRLRPSNFPTVRIAQAIELTRSPSLGLLEGRAVLRCSRLFMTENTPRNLFRLFRVAPENLCGFHFRSFAHRKNTSGRIGADRVQAMVANAVVPVLVRYAQATDNLELERRAFDFIGRLPPEDDEIIRLYSGAGFRATSALFTQGLHQLHQTFCSSLHCLRCPIGQFLLDPPKIQTAY